MAKYTLSIMDILMEKADGKDLQNLNVLRDTAKSALFGEELNLVDEKHRDHFVTGFGFDEDLNLFVYFDGKINANMQIYIYGMKVL